MAHPALLSSVLALWLAPPTAFVNSPEEIAPEIRGGMNKRLSNLHYVTGNEYFLHAFQEDIQNLGGGYVGVGTDQAYILIGWQRPQYVWLVDYDPVVKLIHEMHFAMFAAAETPREFFRLYLTENHDDAIAALEAKYDGEHLAEMKYRFLKHRRMIRLRLWHVRARLKEAKAPSYLTDQETYDYVRKLVLDGHMRPMVGDLTGTETIAGISEAAIELGVPIRVLYLSNAEQYWKEYPQGFRDNVLRLPVDGSSLLLRTKVFRWINDYTYIVQPLENYRAWLCGDGVVSVNDIYGKLSRPDPDKLNKVYLDRDPPDPPPP